MVDDLLQAQGFRASPLPFWGKARRLEEAPFPPGRSLAAFFGLVYIQDISSMLPPLTLAPGPGDLVLDMCASPGSKTGILSGLTGIGGAVVANEPNRSRLSVLRRNLQHQGVLNAVTSAYRGQDLPLPRGIFDYILLDVPCSGWGTEDKNPGIREFWSEDRLDELLAVQKRLLRSGAGLLAPGGRLVYSTCTTNARENEEQVQWAAEECGLQVLPTPGPEGAAVRACPGLPLAFETDCSRGEGQGFFVALLGREGEPESRTFGLEPKGYPRDPGGFLEAAYVQKEIHRVKDKLFRVPGPVLGFSGRFSMQGSYLGKAKKNGWIIAPRLRELLPENPEAEKAVVFDDPAELEGFVRGRSLTAPIRSGACPIYWKRLPLGWARAKNGRLLWTEK